MTTVWEPGDSPVDPSGQVKSESSTPANGTTTIAILSFTYTTGVNALAVFKNGAKLVLGVGYTEVDSSHINLAVACNGTDVIEIVGYVGISSVINLVIPSNDSILATMLNSAFLLPVAKGGTNATTSAAARTNLGAAASGANSDITSLTGLTTPLSEAQGGTGGTGTPAKDPKLSLSYVQSAVTCFPLTVTLEANQAFDFKTASGTVANGQPNTAVTTIESISTAKTCVLPATIVIPVSPRAYVYWLKDSANGRSGFGFMIASSDIRYNTFYPSEDFLDRGLVLSTSGVTALTDITGMVSFSEGVMYYDLATAGAMSRTTTRATLLGAIEFTTSSGTPTDAYVLGRTAAKAKMYANMVSGEAYTDVTAGKVLGTSYTAGIPDSFPQINKAYTHLNVIVAIKGTATITVTPTVAGVALPQMQQAANLNGIYTFDVPIGATYSVAATGAGAAIQKWVERLA